MSIRLLYVSALLLALSGMMRPSVAQPANDGRCEKITIPLCTGMKYNMTRMPNLVGISNQKDAALQVPYTCKLPLYVSQRRVTSVDGCVVCTFLATLASVLLISCIAIPCKCIVFWRNKLSLSLSVSVSSIILTDFRWCIFL